MNLLLLKELVQELQIAVDELDGRPLTKAVTGMWDDFHAALVDHPQTLQVLDHIRCDRPGSALSLAKSILMKECNTASTGNISVASAA
ncbi:MAG: hypothetical protein AAB473_04675 [Patescibacteria group bacterium]